MSFSVHAQGVSANGRWYGLGCSWNIHDFVTSHLQRARERTRRAFIEHFSVMHINLVPVVLVFRYSFLVAMGYLTICHISRIYIFHYGILTTDFSG